MSWVLRDINAWTSAEATKMRQSIAAMPDPGAFARSMTDPQVDDLLHASRGVLPPVQAQALRPLGLVDFASPCLTVFGAKVLAYLVEDGE